MRECTEYRLVWSYHSEFIVRLSLSSFFLGSLSSLRRWVFVERSFLLADVLHEGGNHSTLLLLLLLHRLLAEHGARRVLLGPDAVQAGLLGLLLGWLLLGVLEVGKNVAFQYQDISF